MPDFLTDPLALRTGWTLVHFVWQGALVALLLAFALRLLRGRSPRVRYTAGLSALALMAVLPVVTWHALPEAPVLEQSTPPFSTDVGATSPAPAEAFQETFTCGQSLRSCYGASLQLELSRGRGLNQAHAPTLYWATWRQAEARLAALLPYLVLCWLGGVLVLGARLTGGWVQVQRLRGHGARPVEGCWRRRFEMLARRMGLSERVRLLRSGYAEGPLALGWWRPAVLVPGSLLTGLPPEQVEAILAHELAHIRRYDYAINLAQSALEVVLFYHPAVWWVSAQVRREREYCCDDLAAAACRSRLTYARALTGLETLRGPRLAPGAADGSLLHRIRRLVNPAPPGPSASRATVALAAVGAVAALVLAGSYFPRPTDAEAAPPAAPDEPAAETAAPFDTSLTAGGPVRIALPGDTLLLGEVLDETAVLVDSLYVRLGTDVDFPMLEGDTLEDPLEYLDGFSVAIPRFFADQNRPFVIDEDGFNIFYSELLQRQQVIDSLEVNFPEMWFKQNDSLRIFSRQQMDSLESVFPQNGLWADQDGPHVFFYDGRDTLEPPPEIIFRMEPPRPGEPPLPPEVFEQFQEWELPDLDELTVFYRALVDTTDWQALRRQIRESMEETRRAREETLREWREHREEWQQEYQQELKERRREIAELERQRREELEEELVQHRRELREWHENQERREALREFREELRREQGDLRETQVDALREAAEALGEQAEQLREELSEVEDDSDFALEKRRLLREQIRVFEQQARRLRDRARELEGEQ